MGVEQNGIGHRHKQCGTLFLSVCHAMTRKDTVANVCARMSPLCLGSEGRGEIMDNTLHAKKKKSICFWSVVLFFVTLTLSLSILLLLL